MIREYLTAADLAKRPRPRDIVEGLLFEGCMPLWAGAAKSGKTYLLNYIAHAVATGSTFGGRDVEKGGVLYLLLEGVGMMYDRVRALEIAHNQRSPVIYSPTPLNLLTDSDHVEEINEFVVNNGVRLVVLDTLARATAGIQENSKEEISLAIAALDSIKDQTGAHVAIAHHHGHGAKRARGSSDLLAAPDLIVDLERIKGSEERHAIITANRHGKEGETLRFTLEPIKTDIRDARGRAVESAVVKLQGEWFEDHEAKAPEPKPKPMPKSEREAKELLAALAAKHERLGIGAPTVEHLRKALKRGKWGGDKTGSAWRMAFKRFVDKLEVDSNGSIEGALSR